MDLWGYLLCSSIELPLVSCFIQILLLMLMPCFQVVQHSYLTRSWLESMEKLWVVKKNQNFNSEACYSTVFIEIDSVLENE